MKKTISVIIVISMIITSAVFYANATRSSTGALPTATEGWTMHYIDDETFCTIQSVSSGEIITQYMMDTVANGGFIGNDGGVQVSHHDGAGHLASADSIMIMPNYKLVFKFKGTGIHLGTNFRGTAPMGIHIIVDGIEVENSLTGVDWVPNFDNNIHVIPTVIAAVDGLTDEEHVVEFFGTWPDKDQTYGRLCADWFEIPSTATAVTQKAVASGAMQVTPLSIETETGNGDFYGSLYFWSGEQADRNVNYSFWAKGKAGNTVCIDLEGQGNQNTYTFQTNYGWEFVEGTLTGNADAPTVNGYPFRVYTYEDNASHLSGNQTSTYFIDDMTINGRTNRDNSFTSWTPQSWTGIPGGVIYNTIENHETGTVVDSAVKFSVKDTTSSSDGKFDALYINAAVPDDGCEYGILIAENNGTRSYIDNATMKLNVDGGNPLYVKNCVKYTALLETAAYGTAELTAANFNGTAGDKLIAFYWKDATVYSSFAARVYRLNADNTYTYGPITTINWADGTTNLGE